MVLSVYCCAHFARVFPGRKVGISSGFQQMRGHFQKLIFDSFTSILNVKVWREFLRRCGGQYVGARSRLELAFISDAVFEAISGCPQTRARLCVDMVMMMHSSRSHMTQL
jgi:hypothetical protein